MKRKFLSFLLIFTLIIASAPLAGIDLGDIFALRAEAYVQKDPSHKVWGDYIYKFDDYYGGENEELILVKYTGSEKNIVVPSEIDGHPVDIIGKECFSYNGITTIEPPVGESIIPANPALKEIESVVLPDTIIGIQNDAFANCTKLTSVNFPESLEFIEYQAFDGCDSLKEITLPGKDISYGDYCFRADIEKITLNEGMTIIPAAMFEGTKAESITIPSTVKRIDIQAFYRSRIKTVTVEGYLTPTFLTTPELNFMASESHKLDKVMFRYMPCSMSYYDIYDVTYNEESGYWECVRIAESGTPNVYNDQSFDYILKDGEATLIKYTGTNPYVVMPKTVGFPGINLGTVTEIGSNVFKDTEVTKVIISDTIKRIGTSAFANCSSLTEVVIPESVEKIGNAAFFACTGLETVTLPESVKDIGTKAFQSCSNLKTANWPSSLMYVPSDAFRNCRNLTDFSVFKNVEIIAGGAFNGCESLVIDDFGEKIREIGDYAFVPSTSGNAGIPGAVINTTELPKSLEYLGYRAFAYNSSLKEIVIPEKVSRIEGCTFEESALEKVTILAPLKEIGAGMFSHTAIKSIDLPEGLERIGAKAFDHSEIEEINFPDTVNYIGEKAFWGCRNISSIEIPPLVTKINERTFCDISIESIVIPSTVKSIGKYSFSACKNLKDITIENGVEKICSFAFAKCAAKEITIPESINYLGFDIIEDSQVETVYYNVAGCPETLPSISSDDYPVVGGLMLKKVVFGDKVKKVPMYFAYKSSTLEEVVFSDSIEEIAGYAFYQCNALKKMTLPENLKRIGTCAFKECKLLSEINLPDSLEEIASQAFTNCTALTEITLPEGLRSLHNSAFSGCNSIKTINFNAVSCEFLSLRQSNIEGIYYSPFNLLKSLETINLGSKIKELPAYLFCGIDNISSIVLPSTVTDVGVGAFAFSGITSFKGSENLESIEEYAFYGCDKLTAANLCCNIMLIGAYSFSGCSALTEIYIPDSVTIIEMEAFKDCPALHTVRMSANVDYIPREAFYDCKELSTFTWEAESKLVGRLAFGNCVKLGDFDFVNVEKLYINSFLGSGVTVVQLGESINEESRTPLKTVEVQSFKDCTSLETLGIGGSVSTVKSQAFADCTNLETAVIADSVTQIAPDAFDGCDNLTIYCSENSYAYSYAQTQGIKVSTFVIAPIPNQTYTGSEIKPEVSVSISGDTLSKNVDFGVTYANNINVGKADVDVKGKGDFRMFASRANFTIVTKSISNAVIADIPAQNYTGDAVTPSLTVTDGANILREGVDYTVTYKNNTKEGTATAEIKGIGNYSGSAKASFEIERQSVIQRIISALASFFNSFLAVIKSVFS